MKIREQIACQALPILKLEGFELELSYYNHAYLDTGNIKYNEAIKAYVYTLEQGCLIQWGRDGLWYWYSDQGYWDLF